MKFVKQELKGSAKLLLATVVGSAQTRTWEKALQGQSPVEIKDIVYLSDTEQFRVTLAWVEGDK